MPVELEIGGRGGHVVLVSARDVPMLRAYNWTADERKDTVYARTNTGGRKRYMHRIIMGAPRGMQVDHRDGDGLNNQRSNLRVVTYALNQANCRHRTGGSSRYKGVTWNRRRQRWQAYIMVEQQRIWLGSHDDERDAALAYDHAAREAWGEHARLNLPDELTPASRRRR